METNEEVLDLDETVETTDEKGADTTDWKAEALKAQGIAKRLKTKLEKSKEATADVPVEKKEEPKTNETDLAQEAYLIANGIKEDDERELVIKRMADTGKSLKEIVNNKYLQEDLKDLRDAKAVKNATPSNSNRSGTPATNTVDYWKAKIDAGKASLLDVPDVKLRRDIVNSKLTKEKDVDHFTDNPFGTIDITK